MEWGERMVQGEEMAWGGVNKAWAGALELAHPHGWQMPRRAFTTLGAAKMSGCPRPVWLEVYEQCGALGKAEGPAGLPCTIRGRW